MEVCTATMENSNSVKFSEDKMMVCTNNCEDDAFDDATVRKPEEKLLICANNCEDSAFHMEVMQSSVEGFVAFKGNDGKVLHSGNDGMIAYKGDSGDVKIDIVDSADGDVERVAEMEALDGTESESSSSSSFECTDDSEIENAAVSCDMEVESQMRDNNPPLLMSDGFSDTFRTRKKKLTLHWRNFIRPLMWRCKWLELQLRELQSQACKYEKELAECEIRKQSQLAKCATEALGVKSTPYVGHNQPVKLMKRKKRKRVEETVDLASYTTCHSLFSYYASKKRIADSVYKDDDHGNTGMAPAENYTLGNNELGISANWASFEFKDGLAIESILRKIDEAQLQLRQLRIRTDKVVREHVTKFMSSSCAPSVQFASCATNSTSCVNPQKDPPNSVFTSHQISEKKLVMHDGAVASPDMVENTERQEARGKCEKMEHKNQIYNQPLKERLNNSVEIGDQRISDSELATEVGDPSNGKMPANGTLKVRSISKLITPRNKRKRGRRKALSGRWSKRSSG